MKDTMMLFHEPYEIVNEDGLCYVDGEQVPFHLVAKTMSDIIEQYSFLHSENSRLISMKMYYSWLMATLCLSICLQNQISMNSKQFIGFPSLVTDEMWDKALKGLKR